jgi:hypothetical protein
MSLSHVVNTFQFPTGVRRFILTEERKFKLRAAALPRYAEKELQLLRFINDARNLKRNYELAF